MVNLYQGKELHKLAHDINKIEIAPLAADKSVHQNALPEFDWNPSWLPYGFKLIKRDFEVQGTTPIESLLFSDGLATFVIYASDSKISPDTGDVWKHGVTSIYSINQYQKEFTLIGQIPITTAKRIVQEIQLKPKS